MTIIPSKDNNSFITGESSDFSTLLFLAFVLIIGGHFITNFVAEMFSIPALIVLIGVVVFLIMPSHSNHGRNGARRIIICMKYYIKQIKVRCIK